jgi:hypothetical protein
MAETRKFLELSKKPLVIEVGSPEMVVVLRANILTYQPTLGGYILQEEWLTHWRRSLDNIQEIMDQLGPPYMVEACSGRVRFYWNGTLGYPEDFVPLGFVLGRSHTGCRALADLLARYSCGDQTGMRRRLSARRMQTLTDVLFYDRTVRVYSQSSKKVWTEKEAVRAEA